MKPEDIIKALRCSAMPDEHDCTGCPYSRLEILSGEDAERFGASELEYCDVDKIALDAAYLLEAYRATNHTPEECAAAFEELAAYRTAEQDGTLLRLPCKVGDTVYVLIPADCGFCDKEQCNNIFPCRMSYLVETEFSADIADDFGKTVFLTPEAAEAALKEQEGQK